MSDHHSDADRAPGRDALVERLLDLTVYAPVGVAVTLRDELPRHVKQGRQALENRIQLARFIGQLAVQTGRRELQKRIEQQREARLAQSVPGTDGAGAVDGGVDGNGLDDVAIGEETRRDSDSPSVPPEEPPEERTEASGRGDDRDRSAASRAAPQASELPISDYESLPAINVVDRLRSMSSDEIELVRRFEQGHRARRTILAKIDQLQERHAAG